ncbi:ABC transporter permease [Haloprofundus halobius]|uniref:ABC transporter permease n=1 Tax=Haloprofundus halobius TaxID=2876194 RepID=UPI001CD03DCC|nr:ABC transporter permease [Haloprofundus halobius]
MKRTDEPRTTADERQTDGGSDFETVADVRLSSSERYRQTADELLMTPARIVWSDWRARIAVCVLGFYLFLGVFGPLIVSEPSLGEGPVLLGAFYSLEFPLGTTSRGEDILAQVIYATRPMLQMVAAGAVFTVIVATIVGTTAGYKGGVVDSVLMTLTDVMLTIPGLPLVIVLVTVLEIGANPYLIGVLLSVNAWAGLARALRSQVLTLRDAEYVEASRIMGVPTREILSVDIIPNLMPYITMNFVKQGRAVIFGSVGLYFLGILPQNSDTQNWGLMIDTAVSDAGAVNSAAAVHWLLAPIFAVITFAMGLTLFAQSADRLFNPRVRARHAKTTSDDDEPPERNEGDGTAPAGVMQG